MKTTVKSADEMRPVVLEIVLETPEEVAEFSRMLVYVTDNERLFPDRGGVGGSVAWSLFRKYSGEDARLLIEQHGGNAGALEFYA